MESNFTKLPTELVLITFQEFDIPTLLNVCNVCKDFQQIGTKVLSKKFKEPNVGLILTFEQEYKWRFNIQFELCEFNEQSGNFIFKPKSKQPARFIHSSVVKSPVLSKISLTGVSKNEINVHLTPSTSISFPFLLTSPSPSNSLIRFKNFDENFLQKSLTLNIKPYNDTLKKVHYVFRMGHGTTHLRIPYTFKYSIVDTPPPSMTKTRDGERWLTPISFECAPSFFYPREPTAHKIIINMIHKVIMHLRRNYLSKKNSEREQNTNFEGMEIQMTKKI